MTYTKETVHRVRVVQRATERAMLGITLPDRIRYTDVGKFNTYETWPDVMMADIIRSGVQRQAEEILVV